MNTTVTPQEACRRVAAKVNGLARSGYAGKHVAVSLDAGVPSMGDTIVVTSRCERPRGMPVRVPFPSEAGVSAEDIEATVERFRTDLC